MDGPMTDIGITIINLGELKRGVFNERGLSDQISSNSQVASPYNPFQTQCIYHRDSRQEFEKVGGIFPILHVVFLLDASN